MNSKTEFKLSGISELEESVLPFWLAYAQQGYPAIIDATGRVKAFSPKSTLLLCRLLWSFSAAYRVTKNGAYLIAATELFDYLHLHLFHGEFGPVASDFIVNEAGEHHFDRGRYDISQEFNTLVQAYAIYSFSEYYFVSGHSTAKRWAFELYSILESKSLGLFGTYMPSFFVNSHVPLSHQGCDTRVQMHVLEAYCNLFKATQDTRVLASLRILVDLFLNHIFSKKNGNLVLSFDSAWRSTSLNISFGHNLESAWLLVDAAKLLNDMVIEEKANKNLINILNRTLGLQSESCIGVMNGIDAKGVYQAEYVWWVQAEAVNCLLTAYAITGDLIYCEDASILWNFILHKFKDPLLGEWYSQLDSYQNPSKSHNKVDSWRCSYHSVRVCIAIRGKLNSYNPINIKT